ncbi:GNAT family N-acetyltransferase [Leeuwenhoekiella polynyae]|uniref:Acetyltransferase (GNAT) family protein n=1 Tax=Leeuwenhoekiella polynyae TaxID=1550906 RepID=A0A4V1KQK3_9FLAO|nr:GNAT family N-acetyltransferase [Leeuwenhoekiella polynyae]RXG21712.1 acetyltransferase (GNAT) family protein [Leeuwenhoekiella polynyae]
MSTYKIQYLPPDLSFNALQFLESIFYKEQNIPKKLIPLNGKEQLWWCIIDNNKVVGTVAAWKENEEWHWGRLALHPELRGLGVGKRLVNTSLTELFQMNINRIKVDARDITVGMILKMGGKVEGSKTRFFGYPITPMVIEKHNWKPDNEINED